MTAQNAPKENRLFERSQCRIPCEFTMDGKEYRGFVLDLSASGIFIQTGASAQPGTEAVVTMRPHKADPITVTALVARKLQGHRAMTTVQAKGLGLYIQNAPEVYFSLVAGFQS